MMKKPTLKKVAFLDDISGRRIIFEIDNTKTYILLEGPDYFTDTFVGDPLLLEIAIAKYNYILY